MMDEAKFRNRSELSLLTENHNGDKVTALSVDCGRGDYNVGKQSHLDRQFG
jgi:hypothetical protein